MRRSIPSLLALRYFESAGRNLSFKLAADELNVTQAAVSHQIRILESDLEVKLFKRLHQRVELTAEGEELLAATAGYFDGLEEACERFSGMRPTEKIRLSVTPLVLSRWLLPELDELLGLVPTSELILNCSLEPPNEDEQNFDIKIFFSTKPLHQSSCTLLIVDSLVPMCSPRLLGSMAQHDIQEQCAQMRLIHEFDYRWWEQWFEEASLEPKLARRGIVFDDPSAHEQAALLGSGAILGSTLFLSEHLASGRLVKPFGDEIALPIYYYLHTKASSPQRHRIAQIRSWLVATARSMNSAVLPNVLSIGDRTASKVLVAAE